MKGPQFLKHQKGVAALETALVATVFLVVVFGVIEVGRLLWTWNLLNEVTRRAARLAAVCPVDDVVDLANVQGTSVFQRRLLAGLEPEDVVIEYLGRNGAVLADPVDAWNNGGIYYVRARIADTFEYTLLIPFNIRSLVPLQFETTVNAESLGITPPGAGVPPC